MRGLLIAGLAGIVACGGGPPAPAALIPGVACSSCRMVVSDPRLAAQIAAAGEEPRFFDDIGCLAEYLRRNAVTSDAAVYVADHGSGGWVRAERALYSRDDAIATPMGSHTVAHADEGARAADASVRSAARLTVSDVFGATLPGGQR
ncbi:MAG TPA: nitrous oxide reductase accessory protein NosL [Vicinamibacterales bacterium]|nr:nitrous oxide reductase accessory protein NosL [Vicinamibacterales bacterium]